MRLSRCESHCAGPFRFIPCLPKSKDASHGAAFGPAPRSAAVAEEEVVPPVQKIEVPEAGKGGDEEEAEEHEDGEEEAAATAAAPAKSCLKKVNCGDGKCAAKANVQWLDLLGKDLEEVKEYEPSERGDFLDDEDGISTCVCVIQ